MHPQRERKRGPPRAGWMVMGKGARPSLRAVSQFAVLLMYICPSVSLQCKILRCNSEFWASAASSGPGEFCVALRAYDACVRRTARACRGDLTYHSAQHGVEDLMGQHNCSREAAPPPSRARTPAPPPLPSPDSQERSDGPEVCHYERSLLLHGAPPNYTHCGFFGDPHLRTFSDDFHTCRVEGAWPLIHNKYLSVQVTNTPVLPGAVATATSKLTIIFKNFQECVEQKMYHAETDELPAAFADGSKNGGDQHGASALAILEKVPGQHVEIQARYIGTTIVVRQVGRYLTFAVRMPKEVVNSLEERDEQDLYLCRDGCPLSQRIGFGASAVPADDGHAPTSKTGFTYSSATATCKERLPVEDLYFQSCVFDLLTSGDVSFTMAAYYALEDAKALHSDKSKHHIFEAVWKAGSSAPATHACYSLVGSVGLLLFVLWIQG